MLTLTHVDLDSWPILQGGSLQVTMTTPQTIHDGHSIAVVYEKAMVCPGGAVWGVSHGEVV